MFKRASNLEIGASFFVRSASVSVSRDWKKASCAVLSAAVSPQDGARIQLPPHTAIHTRTHTHAQRHIRTNTRTHAHTTEARTCAARDGGGGEDREAARAADPGHEPPRLRLVQPRAPHRRPPPAHADPAGAVGQVHAASARQPRGLLARRPF